jgi:hypothetical protein
MLRGERGSMEAFLASRAWQRRHGFFGGASLPATDEKLPCKPQFKHDSDVGSFSLSQSPKLLSTSDLVSPFLLSNCLARYIDFIRGSNISPENIINFPGAQWLRPYSRRNTATNSLDRKLYSLAERQTADCFAGLELPSSPSSSRRSAMPSTSAAMI